MQIVVYGGGAVGSLFAARLARARHSILLIARPDHVRAIAERGLRVEGTTEESVRLTAASELASGSGAEAALLTVKTFDLADAARRLARALPTPVPTLLPQNGLGVETLAEEGLAAGGWRAPADWTVRAVSTVPATWIAPGVVRAAGTGELLLPGPSGTGKDALVGRFERLFAGAGIPTRLVPEFDREVWRKALVNAAINPVTAVRGVPNGRLMDEPLRSEALGLLREALAAARANGFDFSESEAVRDLERIARATATNRSSMLQDIEQGRPTEIDAISGELLRRAGAHGLDLPLTRKIIAEVQRRATGRAGRPQPS